MVNERLLRNRYDLISQGFKKGFAEGFVEAFTKSRMEYHIQTLKIVLNAKFSNLPDTLDETLTKLLDKYQYLYLLRKAVEYGSWNDFIKNLPLD